MNHSTFLSIRTQRLWICVCAFLFYALLLVFTLCPYFTHIGTDSIMTFPWESFGFYSLTAVLFMVVGSLVWVYALDRVVAGLLLCFSLTMTTTFTLAWRTNMGDLPLDVVASLFGVLSVTLLAFFVLAFPLKWITGLSQVGRRLTDDQPIHIGNIASICLKIYIGLLSLSTCVAIFFDVFQYFDAPHRVSWIEIPILIHYAVCLIGILVTIIASYRFSVSVRKKQQIRLFVGGVIIASVPLLFLTVIPQALRWHFVSGLYTSATLCLLPLVIGYSILRYQMLILDRYVRRVVSWALGLVFLMVLFYVATAVFNVRIFPSSRYVLTSFVLLCALLVFGSPVVWWLARVLTERLFFSEVASYQRLIDEPAALSETVLDVDGVASLISSAAMDSLRAPQVCLFVLDDNQGCYRLSPSGSQKPEDSARQFLLRSLRHMLALPDANEKMYAECLDPNLPILRSLAQARRPFLLSELILEENLNAGGLSHYLNTASSLGDQDYLLAPIRAQGAMIGLLVLAQRGMQQPYAGPDFEIVQMLLRRFSFSLEVARLYQRANQHTQLLNNLYSVSTMPNYVYKNPDDVASAYVSIAADAAQARAELWLYDPESHVLRLVTAAGSGPRLVQVDQLIVEQESDWSARFFPAQQEGSLSPTVSLPSCLSSVSDSPFAWLPLKKHDLYLGVFVLTYPFSHSFVKEEIGVLEMFSSQCVAALEDIKMNLELQEAYERQKELDLLKDQFIMTASHELRTPLTAVLGYIELLSQYYQTLTPDMLGEFIERARRGCDELTLLVSNIMDASRVGLESSHIHLHPISLLSSVNHVLELLDATIECEHRQVRVDIPVTVYVAADDIRLRQVLLNLISNALKYSPEETPIEITYSIVEEQVIIHIRDYGFGVPEEDQQRLFERFVRLSRDMNSPVRGAGLGLFICKQLLGAMGGDIWVKSSGLQGEGSTFSFALSLAPQDQGSIASPLKLPA